jgi:hypothetical protein
MMLAAVEAVTKADPVGGARRHNSDVAAQATAGESVHAASPPKSIGQNGYNEQQRAGKANGFGEVKSCSCPRSPGDAKLFPLNLGGVVGFEAVNRNGPVGGTAAYFNALVICAYRIGMFQFRRDAKWILAVFEEEAILAIWGGLARR